MNDRNAREPRAGRSTLPARLPASPAPRAAASSAYPITPRAVLVGALCVAALAGINPYLAFVSRTWSTGDGALMGSPVVVLFLLVLLNGLLVRLFPRRAFSRGELIVVYSMLIVSVGLAMAGGMPYLVSATTYPLYMASPGNNWQHSIWPYIPTWLRTRDIAATTWFWEGLPEGNAVPFASWTWPLLAWGSFTFALMAAIFCLGALFSRDWIERQRLTFPLVEVPLAVSGEAERPTLAASILGNRVFWLGFAPPSLLAILGWVHALYPNVPSPALYAIPIGKSFVGAPLPWSVLGDMQVSLVFPVIGISCLLPGEVSLSLWLFYVLYRLQLLTWASFGIAEGGSSSVNIDPRAFIGFEEAGGFIALTLSALYLSRGTLRAAVLDLVGKGPREADPYALLRGRNAVLGFVLANAFLFWWAVQAGMQWWGFALLMGMFYAVLVGAARLVAAGGVMYTDTGFFPRGVVLRTIGAAALTPVTQTLFAYLSVIYMYDPMNLAMPQMMNGFKLLQAGRVQGKRFRGAAALSVLAMLGVGLPALLIVIYHHGASSLAQWPFSSYASWAFGELASTLRTPELPDNFLRLALGLGMAIVFGLVWLHSRFVWWPVSPIGFLIASAYETNRSIWLSALIGWIIATLVRHYGGLKLYRQLRPAFLGLVLGSSLTSGALAIVSSVFGIKLPTG